MKMKNSSLSDAINIPKISAGKLKSVGQNQCPVHKLSQLIILVLSATPCQLGRDHSSV